MSLKNDNRAPKYLGLAQSAVIAALYTALTLLLAPISFGPAQLRVAEMLTILPAVTPSAVVGLTLGCALSNAVGLAMGTNIAGALDILFGSIATLLAALCTRALRNVTIKGLPVLSAIPPVVFNALVVGGELSVVLGLPFWACALEVGAGELIACIGGLVLYPAFKRAEKMTRRQDAR